MTAYVDLHLHTVESDGRHTPEELVSLVAKTELRFIAITDHDSTFAIARAIEAAKAFPPLAVIPGVEVSTDVPHGEVHVLGYFLDYQRPSFQETLLKMRQGRLDRAKKMVQKLAELGMPLEWKRILELVDGGAIGRPHIAQAMAEKGYISTPQEAFAKYLGRDGPAYVEREKLTPVEAVRLICEVDGLPVLAHPADFEKPEELLPELKRVGLVGMEAYYGNYTPDVVERLLALAGKFDLIPCGGSDYHGVGYNYEVKPGTVGPPLETVERLTALAKQKNRAKSP